MRYRNVSQCAGGSSFSASWRISSCSSGSVVSETQMFSCHHTHSQNSHTERQHRWPAEKIGSHSSAGLPISRTYPNLTVAALPVQRGAQSTVRMCLALDKENSPKQTALHRKIPCSLLKKLPLAILADWTSFAQIIYRCNPGTAEGTGNFAISIFGCVHTAWKEHSPEEQ